MDISYFFNDLKIFFAKVRNNFGTSSAATTASVQSAATALDGNGSRIGAIIQNNGTNVLYVYLGSGASTTVRSFTLKAASVNDDGTGGMIVLGNSYNGIITIAGTSPRYDATEW